MDKQTLRVSFLSKGLAWLEFTRPKQLNTFTRAQYIELSETLDELAQDESCSVCVITANGSYFSAGTDLTIIPHDKEFSSHEDEVAFYYDLTFSQAGRLVESMINFPKILIYAVQGPAIGFSATISQLCDFIYCSETAFFHTPFMALSFCSEGCSSYTFPRTLGRPLANDVLLNGRQLSAQLALQHGFVNDVFPVDTFKQQVFQVAAALGYMSPSALQRSKRLGNYREKELLVQVNKEELYNLSECFASEATKNAIRAFQLQQAQRKQQRVAERERMNQQHQHTDTKRRQADHGHKKKGCITDPYMKNINISNFYIYNPSSTKDQGVNRNHLDRLGQSASSSSNGGNTDVDITIKNAPISTPSPGETSDSAGGLDTRDDTIHGTRHNSRLNHTITQLSGSGSSTNEASSIQGGAPSKSQRKQREYQPVPPLL